MKTPLIRVMTVVAVVSVGLTLLSAAGLVHAQRKTDPTLDKLAADFSAAFTARDATKIATFYADDAVLMPPSEPPIEGRKSIEEYFRSGFAQDVGGDLQLRPLESVVAGTRAFEAGTSTLTLRGVSSSPIGGPLTDEGKYVVIYKRVGKDWKIAYDIFNRDNP
jgi:uncharacterized protein (TIGR02246 family)